MVDKFEPRSALDQLANACQDDWHKWVLPRLEAVETALDERDALKGELEATKLDRDANAILLGEAQDEAKRLRTEIEAVKAEIALTEKLLESSNTILKAIPECNSHGACIPHAIEWIESAKTAIAERDALRARIEAAEKQEPCAEITMSCGQFPHKFAFVYNIKNIDIGTKLYALPPIPAQQLPMVERNLMRNLVDRVWMHVTESENVPSTKTADELIDGLLGEKS